MVVVCASPEKYNTHHPSRCEEKNKRERLTAGEKENGDRYHGVQPVKGGFTPAPMH